MSLKGVEVVKDNVRLLSNRPGVYRMLGEKGQILYVGKAKNLKKKGIKLFKNRGTLLRIKRMISEISSMTFRQLKPMWKLYF